MNALGTVCRELTGLFVDDGSLAQAILGFFEISTPLSKRSPLATNSFSWNR